MNLRRLNILPEKEVQRICLKMNPKSPLKAKTGGGLIITFTDNSSIGLLFPAMTNLPLFKKMGLDFGKYWCRILNSPNEETIINNWLDENKELVFIDDSLECSVALGMYRFSPTDEPSPLGKIEHLAKDYADAVARKNLVNLLVQKITQLPFYSTAEYIAAIPKSTTKSSSLSEYLAHEVALTLDKKCLISHVRWDNKTESLQELKLSEKRAALEKAQLTILDSIPNLHNCTIILIDDLYQSGTTMEFVAKALRDKGAASVLGLAVVKSLSNNDNSSGN